MPCQEQSRLAPNAWALPQSPHLCSEGTVRAGPVFPRYQPQLSLPGFHVNIFTYSNNSLPPALMENLSLGIIQRQPLHCFCWLPFVSLVFIFPLILLIYFQSPIMKEQCRKPRPWRAGASLSSFPGALPLPSWATVHTGGWQVATLTRHRPAREGPPPPTGATPGLPSPS